MVSPTRSDVLGGFICRPTALAVSGLGLISTSTEAPPISESPGLPYLTPTAPTSYSGIPPGYSCEPEAVTSPLFDTETDHGVNETKKVLGWFVTSITLPSFCAICTTNCAD